MIERRSGQMPGRSLGEHGHLRGDVGAGAEVPEWLALSAPALVAAADADDATVLDEKPVRRCLGQHECPGSLRLLREVPGHLRDRDDPVPVVAECRGRRDPECALPREEIDALTRNLSEGGKPFELVRTASKQTTDGARIHHRAREEVRSRLLALVDKGNGDSPSLSAVSGSSSSSCPRRMAHARPAGPPPTIRTPTSMRSSGASVGRVMTSSLENGGGKSAARVSAAGAPRPTQALRARRALRASERWCSDRRRCRSRQSRRWEHSRPC